MAEPVEEIAFVVDSSESVGDRGVIKTLLDLLHFHVLPAEFQDRAQSDAISVI